MRAAGVLEAQVSTYAQFSLMDAGIGGQVDLLVFDGPPKTLDEDVVAPNAFAIHADFDVLRGQHLDEVGGGEVAALVRVEDFGLTMFR